jgi:hypothetical protein
MAVFGLAGVVLLCSLLAVSGTVFVLKSLPSIKIGTLKKVLEYLLMSISTPRDSGMLWLQDAYGSRWSLGISCARLADGILDDYVDV